MLPPGAEISGLMSREAVVPQLEKVLISPASEAATNLVTRSPKLTWVPASSSSFRPKLLLTMS